MNVIRIKRGENILTKNITLMAGELALDTATGVLYTSLVDNGNPVEIKGAASGTVSKAEKADYATKLETKQLIKLTGDVTGEANFDGSAAAEITAVLANITTGATVNGITFNNKGLITGATKIKVVDVDGLETALAGKVDKVEGKSLIADTEITRLASVSNYNDTEVRGLISQNAEDIEAIETAISEIVIPTKVSELTDAADYVTDVELEGKGYLTEIPADYVTETELTGKGYLVANDIAGKADKTELHSHDNKNILDATTASYTTAEKTKLAGLENYNDAAVLAELDTKANKTDLNAYTTTENLNVLLAEKADKADTLAEYGITDAYTKTEVDGMVAGTFHFKGEKASLEELNALTGMKEGDVYQVGEKEYAYNGTAWVELGFNIDLSAYAKTADVAATYATITNLNKKANSADVYTKSDVYTKTEADAAFMTNAEVEAKGYATTTAMNTALSAKANSADVYTKTVADSTFLKEVPAEYITETELNAKNYAVKGTTLASYGITNALATDSVIDGGTF